MHLVIYVACFPHKTKFSTLPSPSHAVWGGKLWDGKSLSLLQPTKLEKMFWKFSAEERNTSPIYLRIKYYEVPRIRYHLTSIFFSPYRPLQFLYPFSFKKRTSLLLNLLIHLLRKRGILILFQNFLLQTVFLLEQNGIFNEAASTSQLLHILGIWVNAVLLSVSPLPSLELEHLNFSFAFSSLTLEVFFC